MIANKQKNIYDMAGNLREWTMEAYGTTRIGRGATRQYANGAVGPASERGWREITYNTAVLGFRITMYVNN